MTLHAYGEGRNSPYVHEPEHVLFTGVDTQDPFQHWFIEHCRCGWEGNPKLSEMAAMDEGAQHIERFCL